MPKPLIQTTGRRKEAVARVRLRAGSVILPAPAPGTRPGLFHAKEGQTLSEFMDRSGPALTDQQLIDVVKALHAAGLIKAEVKSQ